MIQQLSNVGFSIIKALAEQINAQLFISSEKNQGTEIKLLIPLL
jgi:nitrate/nitrite-specific signal transduction histidine kinase